MHSYLGALYWPIGSFSYNFFVKFKMFITMLYPIGIIMNCIIKGLSCIFRVSNTSKLSDYFTEKFYNTSSVPNLLVEHLHKGSLSCRTALLREWTTLFNIPLIAKVLWRWGHGLRVSSDRLEEPQTRDPRVSPIGEAAEDPYLESW